MGEKQHHVVIIGGGFGGLYTVKQFKRAPVRVTLIDKRNFHLFQPLLYQVATGALSPADIASPLRGILHRQKNVQVILDEVVGFDVEKKQVLLREAEPIAYDSLIVAAGSANHYFDHPTWIDPAPGLKTIEDALSIRSKILYAFEAAERETDPAKIKAWLTFIVIGGGPTGVEMAGAIAEIARFTLKNNFRRIDPTQATIQLIEGIDRVLPVYPRKLSARAKRDLEKMGVTVRLNTQVTDIQEGQLTVKTGDQTERMTAQTIVWMAGVKGSPLGQALASVTGAELDRIGRVIVQADMSLPNYPNIFVIGDMANFSHQTGQPLPGVAQVAMQQGRYVARLVQKRIKGEAAPPPFRYKNLGNMATIGRAAAVADFGWLRLAGFIGWLAWLFVHLMKLVGFENRLSVFVQWAYSYFTRNRSARLITGEVALPHDE